MPVIASTVSLLAISNVFRAFAWCTHFKELNTEPWLIAVLVSGGIAPLEYLLQMPGNSISHTLLMVGQMEAAAGENHPS